MSHLKNSLINKRYPFNDCTLSWKKLMYTDSIVIVRAVSGSNWRDSNN